MIRKDQLTRLDRLTVAFVTPKEPENQLTISEELSRDDPERLALFLEAADRAGLLDIEPSPHDESQFAQFLRDARKAGLIRNRPSPDQGG